MYRHMTDDQLWEAIKHRSKLLAEAAEARHLEKSRMEGELIAGYLRELDNRA